LYSQKQKDMQATFKITDTKMTNLGLATTYEVDQFIHSGAVVSNSDKKISAAFKIIFAMKGTTKIQKVKAVNQSGLDLSFEEWNRIFSMFHNELNA
jgi:hypothetical protein